MAISSKGNRDFPIHKLVSIVSEKSFGMNDPKSKLKPQFNEKVQIKKKMAGK